MQSLCFSFQWVILVLDQKKIGYEDAKNYTCLGIFHNGNLRQTIILTVKADIRSHTLFENLSRKKTL